VPAIKISTSDKLYRELYRADNNTLGEDELFLSGTTDAQRATMERLMNGAEFIVAEDGSITVTAGG
jgi:hypothetical protein